MPDFIPTPEEARRIAHAIAVKNGRVRKPREPKPRKPRPEPKPKSPDKYDWVNHKPRQSGAVDLQSLAHDVSAASGLRPSVIYPAIKAMLDIIVEAVAAGHTVQLRGHLTFYSRVRKPRPARNPRTGDPVMLPWRRVMLCRWPGGRVSR